VVISGQHVSGEITVNVLEIDVGKHDLHAALLQGGRPASKSVPKTPAGARKAFLLEARDRAPRQMLLAVQKRAFLAQWRSVHRCDYPRYSAA
jgi:hypothetical protein